MPVDPKGITPGLSPQAEPGDRIVNMKCRNSKCGSFTAVEIKVQNPGQRIYRCTECGDSWSVNVGGNLNL